MLRLTGITVRYGDTLAAHDVTLEVPGEAHVLALLGPSGSGKTTVLRAVAGLEPIASGSITLGGEDLAAVPVHKRRIGLVFQDGQLFPHKSVAGNIAYGLALAKDDAGKRMPRPEQDGRVSELLDLVGMSGFGPRRVHGLSGGEAQRVALARALAPRPRLLLLDEPLSALDRGLRDRLATDVRDIVTTHRTPTIVVTHDHSEAAFLADRIAVLIDGRIHQVAAPRDLWRRPADRAVARFLGFEAFLDADVRHGVARCVLGAVGVDAPDGPAVLALGQHSLTIAPHGPVSATVLSRVVMPDGLRLRVAVEDMPGGRTELGAVGTLHDDAEPGQAIRLGLDGRRTGLIAHRGAANGAALDGATAHG
ncbi:ABC transporter ATP-binding protein [Lolliginicoccus levis]|uniref:ABC transporter ATP-binding protein n=1 Tax=Lolliginicoccus levis TaxID=2919542 RepID=UPI00241D2271|nr:ABC transporter ATP-binding protein [Lolliginicoccus levis]